MPQIDGHGWELLVERIGLQSKSGEPTRTYGSYQVFIDGQPVAGLSGHLCERTGPGDNTKNGKDKHLRIHEGRYPISTQFGEHYRSVGYGQEPKFPMPGFLLLGTEVRSAILVHPGHPPTPYISSIGCLNPTKALTADKVIDFPESRDRVIAMIDSLRQHDAAAFAHSKIGHNTPVAHARVVVDGEPMTPAAGAMV